MPQPEPALRAPDLPLQIPSLDGMRAVSIMLVLFAHAASTRGFPEFFDRESFTSLGNVGVRFFFVISGFLITTLLLRDLDRHGHVRLPLFYKRRALRILPAALAYIGVIWAAYMAGLIDLRYQHLSDTQATSAVPGLLHALSFTYNYKLDYNWYFNHLWSLSVEEQFYLLWPFTLAWLGLARGARVALAALLVVPFIRLGMHLSGEWPELALSRNFQAVCDSIATGCLGAIFFNAMSTRRAFAWLTGWPAIPIAGACIAIGYGSALFSRPIAYVAGQSLANLGILLLLLHVITRPRDLAGRILNTGPMVAIGVLSYSLYLWQEPFLYFRGTGWATAFPQNIVLTFIAAYACHRLVEKPFLAIKQRLGTKPVAPATPDPATPA
ncbi:MULTISPECIES: acyltransferase [unclassified Luteimonas]|uniref:acyltransferase family protein n=1 Tax=unclassified Luteimonas TaxID=2629088 RepID=UPI0018F074AF|nr:MULTISPECIES: acyltransferase [unclassified Luteimonas]MBJ6978219.1 acyltransferase [Luteimonas sp. MC1895]MBJ6984075.1 acyltransferase [Luteimonas sp. MC1750]QQO06884.1 acyltransferase [Luteimonas sp. MC1750]